MITLEQTKNGYESGPDSEAAEGAIAAEGGVGKPGGFTNTNDDPRAGGAVVLPRGIANTSLFEGQPVSPLPRLGNRSFSPEISARNKPVGLVSDGK